MDGKSQISYTYKDFFEFHPILTEIFHVWVASERIKFIEPINKLYLQLIRGNFIYLSDDLFGFFLV